MRTAEIRTFGDYITISENDMEQKWRLIREAAEELEKKYRYTMSDMGGVRIRESEKIIITMENDHGFTVVGFRGDALMVGKEIRHGNYTTERTLGRAGTGRGRDGEGEQERAETGTIEGV